MINVLIIFFIILTIIFNVTSDTKADKEKLVRNISNEEELQKIEVVRFNTKAKLISQIKKDELNSAESSLRKLQMLDDKEEKLLV